VVVVRESSVGLVWFVAVCTRKEREDLDAVVIVEEERGGEDQWRYRVWVSGNELEFDEEEDEEIGGSGCGGLAFMAGPFGSKEEWEWIGDFSELFEEKKIKDKRERDRDSCRLVSGGSTPYYVEYVLSSRSGCYTIFTVGSGLFIFSNFLLLTVKLLLNLGFGFLSEHY
jgi:hypothetical protein